MKLWPEGPKIAISGKIFGDHKAKLGNLACSKNFKNRTEWLSYFPYDLLTNLYSENTAFISPASMKVWPPNLRIHSLRLYNNGVLHSQFSERCPATGSVWDLLWLPALFRVSGMPRRVLLLGAGAGTVIRQLTTVFGPLEITAVENDPIHLQVARDHFGVTDSMATLELADAGEFVGSGAHPPEPPPRGV